MTPNANRIGRYEIKEKLGEGGMGVVYRAIDAELMREVAIKVIRREALGGGDLDALERFDREAKAAGQLKHPSIVTIYDRGEWNGLPYLVMELVEGRTFDQLLAEEKPDPSRVLSIISQVGSAVDYAHQRGVIHRDLKPANILVQKDGTAKILDFGIAKFNAGGAAATQVGMLVGSPSYMPPERFLGDDTTRSTDIWALGVTAFEALTGQRPFQGNDWQAVAYQICNQPPPDPLQLNPAVPRMTADVLRRVLSKKPEERYEDCAGFTAALTAALKSPAGDSPRPSAPAAPADRGTQAIPVAKPFPIGKAIGGGAVAGGVLAAVVWFSGLLDPASPVKGPEPLAPPASNTKSGPAPVLETPTGTMLLVPAGEARLGADLHTARLDAYYIDKTEVPVGAYRRFCEAAGRAMPDGMVSADAGLPATNVTWDDAAAFAAWAGKRLPSSEEWEKAARGATGQLFPWSNEFEPSRANLRRGKNAGGGPVAVDSSASGASPYGALHMVGNVWEWTAADAVAPPGERFAGYSRMFRELKPPLGREEPFKQVRGGSFLFAPTAEEAASLCSDFGPMPARVRRPDIGFRCVRSR